MGFLSSLGSAIGGMFAPDHSEDVRKLNQQNIDDYSKDSEAYGASQGVQNAGFAGKSAQGMALDRLGQLSNASGLDPQAKAMQQQAMQQSNQAANGMQQAALQKAQMSGGYGGGLGQAAALQGAQSGANANAMAATQAAGDSRSRALQALGAYSGLAGGMRGQDINQAQLGFNNQMGLAQGRTGGRGQMANFITNKDNADKQKAQGWGDAIGGIADTALTGGFGAMGGAAGSLGKKFGI